ncbi:hypothetical protein EVAR_44132_1 [Eumeta japonica]|uniref:Uncharacterized protein n=1 Tax=Eumeta variegata TaxID=151549 RepID=A0A4C1XP96_EUMVA|nr:hypothetical protein EVAR_44132_1 [Eumeta japonica]
MEVERRKEGRDKSSHREREEEECEMTDRERGERKYRVNIGTDIKIKISMKVVYARGGNLDQKLQKPKTKQGRKAPLGLRRNSIVFKCAGAHLRLVLRTIETFAYDVIETLFSEG